MEMVSLSAILAVAGAFSAVGGAWLTYKKIQKDSKQEAEENAAKILLEAKEEDAKVKTELENKINTLKTQLENLESTVNKDLDHIRETYNGEIRNLGQKIEDLRSELRNQHGQLVQLLSKLIEHRD